MLHQEDQCEVSPQDIIEAQFHTGRFRWVDVVMRRWAYLLEETLFEELDVIFDQVEPVHVEWMRFSDFFKDIVVQPIYIFETEHRGKGLLLLENSFANACMDQNPEELLKNSPLNLDTLNGEKLKRLRATLDRMLADFEKSWLRIADVSVALKKITTHPFRARVMLPFERCLVARMKFHTGTSSSQLSLCFPYSSLHPILTQLEDHKVIPPESVEHYHPEIEEHFKELLQDASHEMVAELGNVDLRAMGSSIALTEGQILPIKNSKLTLNIKGAPVLVGKAGESSGKRSVQVTAPFEDKQDPRQAPKTFQSFQWSSK